MFNFYDRYSKKWLFVLFGVSLISFIALNINAMLLNLPLGWANVSGFALLSLLVATITAIGGYLGFKAYYYTLLLFNLISMFYMFFITVSNNAEGWTDLASITAYFFTMAVGLVAGVFVQLVAFIFIKRKKKMNRSTFISIFLILFTLSAGSFVTYLSVNNGNTIKYLNTSNPKDYKELYSLIKKINHNDYNNAFIERGDIALTPQKSDTASESTLKDYSDTNLQVLGVQEADIIKTDGNYIYALTYDKLYIIKADKGKLELVSTIKHSETKKDSNSNFVEIYVQGNKLVAIKQIYEYSNPDPTDGRKLMPDIGFYYGSSDIGVVVFDITNKSKPSKLSELSQSGSYLSSRMIDSYLYLITNHYIYNGSFQSDNVEDYVPLIKTKEKEALPVDDIYIVPNPVSAQYVVVSGMDINKANDFVSNKAIFGSGNNIYASLDNLYIASYDSVETKDTVTSRTNILKFSLNKGNVKLQTTGSVNGSILNQFSMDENDNYFRIVTTTNEYKIWKDNEGTSDGVIGIGNNNSNNNLYVLDKNLKLVGKIEKLAEGERIYSVRFDKDIVYFVTFKQVDPLFAVDLSTPSDPQILSILKIPGFSEYLHVYNDNLLFGLGKEADKDGRVIGMKLSMFDITDKANITEKFKLSLGDNYLWSEASYNHKAILVSTSKGLIGFPVNNSYLIYKFDNAKGFSKVAEINVDDYYYGLMRGLYIDDYFYIFSINEIKSYDLDSFSNINSLILEKNNNVEGGLK